MGGVADTLFGGGAKTVNAPSSQDIINKFFPDARNQVASGLNISTPYSSINAKTGALSFDPTGRDLQLGGLNTYQTNLGQTRNSLLGNQGAFIQARVNPLLQQLALGRGQLQRTLGQTGVRGTFANQALQNYDILGSREEADARALATNDTLNQLTALDTALFGAETGVGSQLNADQLAQLGLSAATIYNLRSLASNLTTNSASTAVTGGGYAASADAQRAANISGALGSGLSALGTYFGFGA